MEKKDHYHEALRYIDNAKEILRTKAGKDGDFYQDSKYVKMACNTAWNGVLVALDGRMKRDGLAKDPKARKNVDIYRNYLAKNNQKMLKHFNSAYNHLHLLGGYDGDLRVSSTQDGIKMAMEIIAWCI